jgi:hypothetical protein
LTAGELNLHVTLLVMTTTVSVDVRTTHDNRIDPPHDAGQGGMEAPLDV